jgi:hypothetical protein
MSAILLNPKLNEDQKRNRLSLFNDTVDTMNVSSIINKRYLRINTKILRKTRPYWMYCENSTTNLYDRQVKFARGLYEVLKGRQSSDIPTQQLNQSESNQENPPSNYLLMGLED